MISEKLRSFIVRELHFSHFGISKIKALARSFVWRPSLDHDLEKITRSCIRCFERLKKPVSPIDTVLMANNAVA